MNWWRQLKIWQKWGIVFTGGHFILISLFFAVLQADGRMLILMIDLPIVPLADLFFRRLYLNSNVFPVVYHLLVGSLLYGLLGIVLGWLAFLISRNRPH